MKCSVQGPNEHVPNEAINISGCYDEYLVHSFKSVKAKLT